MLLQVLPQSLTNEWRTLLSANFARYLISAINSGSTEKYLGFLGIRTLTDSVASAA